MLFITTFWLLNLLNIPLPIMKLNISWLTVRTQQVKCAYFLSSLKVINRGNVQGSGLGHILHMIFSWKMISNLYLPLTFCSSMPTIHTYLFLKTDVWIFVEFDNIDKWTANNYMVVSLVKTKDTVFHQPSARSILPVAVIATEQTCLH